MKQTLVLVAAVLAAVCVSAAAARSAGGAVLAPVPSAALESFLEAGAHTDAEIEAMAQAEVAAVLGDADEAEVDSESESADEHSAEAAVEHDIEAEAEAEMPRDTKAEEARQKRIARAKARAAAAARPPVPPPSGGIAAATGGDSDIIRLVYDELQRLGSMSTPAPGVAGPASSLGVTDPRIATLEHRLTSYESAAAEKNYKAKSGAINALATRLEGLDKTLAALKKSQAEQQRLSARLLKATKKAEAKQDAGNAVDYSVGYVKATLPADFDAKVNAILKSVKTEARKIYERYCKRAGIKPQPDTPKSYPSDKPGAPAPAAAAPKEDAAAEAAAPAKAAAAAGASMAPLPASANPAVAEAAAAKAAARKAVVGGKAQKILFKPIITGHEPTPEGMRLSKALNDISKALPVTPAYQLSPKEKALHDVLGESAVNPNMKTARFNL